MPSLRYGRRKGGIGIMVGDEERREESEEEEEERRGERGLQLRIDNGHDNLTKYSNVKDKWFTGGFGGSEGEVNIERDGYLSTSRFPHTCFPSLGWFSFWSLTHAWTKGNKSHSAHTHENTNAEKGGVVSRRTSFLSANKEKE